MLNRLLVVTFVGGLVPLAAGLWWPFELTSHFRLQYLIPAVVLLSFAVLWRRRILAAALVAVLALNAWPLLPYLPRSAPAAAGSPFTLLNINVNAGNPAHDRVLETIRGSGADGVALIELSHALDARLDELADIYPYSLRRPADGNFGLGVLSRYPLDGAHAFELVTTTALSTAIATPGGELRLIAAHLVPPMTGKLAAERNRQLELLADLAGDSGDSSDLGNSSDSGASSDSGDSSDSADSSGSGASSNSNDSGDPGAPLLLCGDFNLSPYSPYFRRFAARSGLRDTRAGHGFGISWPQQMPLLGIPIDHCFVHGPLAAEAVVRMDPTGSDHYPVLVRLRWLDQP